MSSRPSRSNASSGSYSLISTSMPGWLAASSSTTGSSERRIAVAKPATRTTPSGSASGSRSRRAASTAARIVDGVLGEPAAGRGQPHPPAVRLDQRSADLAGQGRDVLGDARRGHAQLVGHLAHRAQPRELEEDPQAPDVHAVHCSETLNNMSSKVTWTRTVLRVFTGPMTASSNPTPPRPLRPHRRRAWRWPRCSASSSAWPPPSA